MTISIVLDLIVRVVYERQNEMWKDSTEDDDDNGRQVITIAHKAFSKGSYKNIIKIHIPYSTALVCQQYLHT